MRDNTVSGLEVFRLAAGYAYSGKRYPVTESFDSYVPAGCMVSIMGPNGSGKTTLLKTLSCMIPAFSGHVAVKSGFKGQCRGAQPAGEKGRELNASGSDESETVLTGMRADLLSPVRAVVLSKPPETGILSVYEVVSMGRSPHTGWSGKLSEIDREVIMQALELTGIETLSDRIFSRLSDGEKQKAMLARALAQDTPLVFLDEPSAFLDLPSRFELARALSEIKRQKNRIIISTTHDLDTALEFSDILWVIDSGGKVTELDPGVYGKEHILKRFFRPDHSSFLK